MSGMMLAFSGGSYGAAPVNTVAPAVTGTATVGQTLSTTNGTWTGAPAPTFTYQWQRVTTNISGATSSTYTLVAADAGNTIRCVVTATNTIAPSGVSANSNSTASVAATVPGAPTIGTATVLYTTASVPFTAPASNGGATITSYTATSSPDGITGTLSQAGSGTVTVSGLTGGTSYTFTVKATNSVGQGAASAASNSVTAVAAGQIAYTSGAQFTTFVVPAGVTSISLMTVGRGGLAGISSNYYYCCPPLFVQISGGGGGGGALVYKNNISVTPGQVWCVRLGCSSQSFFRYSGVTYAGSNNGSGGQSGGNGGQGGAGGSFLSGTTKDGYKDGGSGGYGLGGFFSGGGGGGAGGYSGNGGNGGCGSSNGIAGSGGSGGGGAGGTPYTGYYAGGGGGVGLLGQGSSGARGTAGASSAVRGGNGSCGTNNTQYFYGGLYGGGAGNTGCCGPNNNGGRTGARIIWPGTTRQYPSTCTQDV
jgi:hypothetical protein